MIETTVGQITGCFSIAPKWRIIRRYPESSELIAVGPMPQDQASLQQAFDRGIIVLLHGLDREPKIERGLYGWVGDCRCYFEDGLEVDIRVSD